MFTYYVIIIICEKNGDRAYDSSLSVFLGTKP